MDSPFATALSLIIAFDPDLMKIIGLSLRVTLTAVLLACVVGLPLGAGLALARFPGRGAVIVLFNALMSALMIRTVDGGHKANAYIHLVVMVWLGVIVAVATKIVVGTFLAV